MVIIVYFYGSLYHIFVNVPEVSIYCVYNDILSAYDGFLEMENFTLHDLRFRSSLKVSHVENNAIHIVRGFKFCKVKIEVNPRDSGLIVKLVTLFITL